MSRFLSWSRCLVALSLFGVGATPGAAVAAQPKPPAPVKASPAKPAAGTKSASATPAAAAAVNPATAPAPTVKGPAKKLQSHYALLIGVNKYAPPLGELKYCNADMAALRDHFIAAGYPEDHICFMEDDAEKSWLRPTKSNILTQAQNWLKTVGKDDVIVIAFSGHGVRMQNKDQSYGSYLCPGDANLETPEDSMVSVDALYAMMEKSKAAQRLLFIDACRNDLIREGTKAAGFTKGYVDEPPPTGVVTLSSCAETEFSTEDPDFKHGVFMHYVLRGLQGDADREIQGNNNGVITLTELFEYTAAKTKTHALQKHGVSQLPRISGDYSGGIELAYVPDAKGRETLIERESKRFTDVIGGGEEKTAAPAGSVKHPLLSTADAYFGNTQWENAISAYTGIIDDTTLPIEVRHEARRGRAAAYAARGRKTDIDAALIDSQAIGQAGVSMVVKAGGNLMLGKNVVGKVAKDQQVVFTQPSGEYVFVVSVNGKEMRGYLLKSALVAPPPAAVATVAPTTTTKSVSPQPYKPQQPRPRPTDDDDSPVGLTPAQKNQWLERKTWEHAAEQMENGTWTLGSGRKAAEKELRDSMKPKGGGWGGGGGGWGGGKKKW